jgi:membrane-associated phospholipid phosphatase
LPSLTTLLKIILYVCHPASGLVSPSGHTSLSVLIYGAIVLVIAAEQRGWLRSLILVIGGSLILAIAGSRLWVKAHSVPEVLIGTGIGIATLSLFGKCYLSSRTEGKGLLSLILPTIVVTALLHGQELRAEALLHAIIRHVSLAGIACIQ